MKDDPYKRVAGIYDRIFEPMNKGLRTLGLRMFTPSKGSSILDVGCGTGTHLEMYSETGCSLHGVDTSPSMLRLARSRLGKMADLRLANGSELPYQSEYFNLILSMLVLHEMKDYLRNEVIQEMKRVLKPNGRILLIDFNAGTPTPGRGWLLKMVITLSEIAAGRIHFQNYRRFMGMGGLPSLIETNQLRVEGQRIVGDGTMALYLLSR